MAQLSEIPVDLAAGSVAKNYDEIRYRSGAAVPALLFRHLASRPPLLEWLWASVGPRFIDGSVQATAESLVSGVDTGKPLDLPNPSQPKHQTLGITSRDRETLQSVLDTYNRMNPMNLLTIQLCLHVMEQRAEETSVAGREVAPPARLPDIPAAVALSSMSPDTKQLTQKLAKWIPTSAYGSITPTLYRHLANWPAFLKLAGGQILERLQDGSIQRSSERLLAASSAAAAKLPTTSPAWSLPGDQQTELKAATDPFFVCIPQLIVVGKLISESL
jgi:hypothetical protein